MAIAAVLLLIVVASVLFHWFTPWWALPLASNWRQMDDTLAITVVITGIFFVAIVLFLIYTLWCYRHRTGSSANRRAAYEPESPKLERWLIGITTLGIAGLLAPGLVVYAEYVRPPPDALVLEVVGQQWQWRFRFPGASGELGGSDARFVSAGNPFGLDPGDARARDDILVTGNEVHLPRGRPVKVLMRSHDVLHDFFVPPFRARMNIVPGQVSTFWFTPTQAGRFEAMCAQLCGVGHPVMRGFVVVEDEAAFRVWLGRQPTFAQTQMPVVAGAAAAGALGGDTLAALGGRLAQVKGCVACHSTDGSARVGPSWKGLYGKTEQLDDGTRARVDEAFLKGFIRNPAARSIKGYPALMPRIELADDELDALVAYIKSNATP